MLSEQQHQELREVRGRRHLANDVDHVGLRKNLMTRDSRSNEAQVQNLLEPQGTDRVRDAKEAKPIQRITGIRRRLRRVAEPLGLAQVQQKIRPLLEMRAV